jgi:phenylalanyl-tRNA synthetase beta chain
VSHSLLAPTLLEDARSEELRVPIRSALSAELSGLRRSLLPGLLDALERNLRRGNAPLAFFEVGRVFSREGDTYSETMMIGGVLAGQIGAGTWEKRAQSIAADFYTVRGLLERLADSLHITGIRFERSEDPRLHPGRSAIVSIGDRYLGTLGELHPRHTADLRLKDGW